MSYSDRAAPQDDIDIAALGSALWRSRYRILAITLTAGVLGYVFLSSLTPKFSGESRVLIEHEESAFTRPEVARDETRQVLLDQEAVESQVQVLLSRDLSSEVARKLDLAKNPEFNDAMPGLFKRLLIGVGLAKAPSDKDVEERVVNAFRDNLSVFQVTKSRVIVIEFRSRSADVAAKAANELAASYIAWQRKEVSSRTSGASDWLARQIDELRLKVADSEERAEQFRSKQGLYAGTNNVTLNTQQLSELNSQIIVAKAQRSEAEARARLIREMLKAKGDVDSASDVLKSETIGRLLEQRVQVQRQLAELSATLRPGHPRMRQLSSELADVRGQIRTEARKVVQSLENEAQIAGARENSLRKSLTELKSQAAESGEDEIKLRALEREAKANRDLLESYLARYRDASARGDLGALPSNATIISRAHASSTPSFPKKAPLTLLIMAVALLLSVAFVLARALLSPKAREQIESRPIGASLLPPRRVVAEPEDIEPVAAEEPEYVRDIAAPRLRSLEAVMTQIQLRLARLKPLQVLIASSRGSDAVTDAIEIARTLATPRRSVVLVDLSRASSSLPSQLGIPRTPGYYDLVAGTSEFEDIIRVDPKSAVQVICAGGGLTGQSDKLSIEELPRVLEALGDVYDATVLHADSSTLESFVEVLGDDAPQTVVVCGSASGAAADLDDSVVQQLTEKGRLVAVYDKSRPNGKRFGSFDFGNRAASL